MAEFKRVAKATEIGPGEARAYTVEGRQIGIANIDGNYYAFDDICTHDYASLCAGSLDGEEIVCPLHAARFNVKTGEVTAPPAFEDVATYEVRKKGDWLEVLV